MTAIYSSQLIYVTSNRNRRNLCLSEDKIQVIGLTVRFVNDWSSLEIGSTMFLLELVTYFGRAFELFRPLSLLEDKQRDNNSFKVKAQISPFGVQHLKRS